MTELQVAARLGYMSDDDLEALQSTIVDVGKMARGLHDSLQRARPDQGRGPSRIAEEDDYGYE